MLPNGRAVSDEGRFFVELIQHFEDVPPSDVSDVRNVDYVWTVAADDDDYH